MILHNIGFNGEFNYQVFGWSPETGFFTKRRVAVHRLGKNPVSYHRIPGQKPGFLRQYFVAVQKLGKNPVSSSESVSPQS